MCIQDMYLNHICVDYNKLFLKLYISMIFGKLNFLIL